MQALERVTDNLTKVFDVKIAAVLEAINNQMVVKMIAVDVKIEEVEKRFADVETVATNSEAKIADIETHIKRMQERIDDLDNRSCRCNVRIIGFPEVTEGSDPVMDSRTPADGDNQGPLKAR